VALKLVNNGQTVFSTSGGGDLKNVVFHIHGREIASKMIPIAAEREPFKLSGLLGRPEASRASRALQSFFVNGRYVRSAALQSAVEEGFRGLVMAGKFPAYVLRLDLPHNMVDVNVHPNKLEIRFQREEAVISFVRDSVSGELLAHTLIPEESPRKTFAQAAEAAAHEASPAAKAPPRPALSKREIERFKAELSGGPEPGENASTSGEGGFDIGQARLKEASEDPDSVSFTLREPEAEEILHGDPGQPPGRKKFFDRHRIAGQIFQTYWIVEQGDSVYFIDQHAAHERVVFERLLERFQEGCPASQRLLEPVLLHLSEREMDLADDNMSVFEGFGFDAEKISGHELSIKAVPHILGKPQSPDLFLEALDALSSSKSLEDVHDLKRDAIATMACKAAVKANDRLSEAEAEALIEEMLRLDEPFTCPHGRPAIIEMTKREWERNFKRTT
jgi:DNA mismatch repair protein MutL